MKTVLKPQPSPRSAPPLPIAECRQLTEVLDHWAGVDDDVVLLVAPVLARMAAASPHVVAALVQVTTWPCFSMFDEDRAGCLET